MLRAYLRDLVISYVANTVKRLDKRDPEAADLMSWVIENAGILKLDTRQKAPPRRTRRDRVSDAADSSLTEDSWEEFRETLCHQASDHRKAAAGPDCKASPASRRHYRHLSNRYSNPRGLAVVRDGAGHRFDDRRRLQKRASEKPFQHSVFSVAQSSRPLSPRGLDKAKNRLHRFSGQDSSPSTTTATCLWLGR